MAAVAASALHSRMLRRDSTDHDVIDVASGVTSNQVLQASVHVRCTGARHGHVFPRRKHELGKKNQRASKEDRTRFPEHVVSPRGIGIERLLHRFQTIVLSLSEFT